MDYAQVKGFNYMPGYSGHLQYTWTNFNREYREREGTNHRNLADTSW